MAELKLPDPKKTSGTVLGLAVAAALGLVTYAYILPFLNKVVWGTAQLAVGALVVGLLGYVVFSPTFWRRSKIILDALGEMIFGGFVEMNPFAILKLQLRKAEKDREELKDQNEKLRGQEARLRDQLDTENQNVREYAAQIEICKNRLATNPNDDDTAMNLETATTNFSNSKDFIDSVQPIYNDIKKLAEFTDKAYRKSGNALKNAIATVDAQKLKYDAVTAGSSAMKKALRAFTGDPEMNNAAKIAMDKLRLDIANKVGTIRTTIKATSEIMNERDLKDAAKVSLATQTVENLNIDQAFDYAGSIDQNVGNVPVISMKNKYIETLKK